MFDQRISFPTLSGFYLQTKNYETPLTRVVVLLFSAILATGCQREPSNDPVNDPSESEERDMGGLKLERGLAIASENLLPGYVLFNPTNSALSYLINRKGEVVHQWLGDFPSDLSTYLIDNGNLLRVAQDPDFPIYHGGGNAGPPLFLPATRPWLVRNWSLWIRGLKLRYTRPKKKVSYIKSSTA